MRYIDSGIRQQDQTVAWWMQQGVDSGIEEFRCQSGYFTIEGSGILLPSLRACAQRGSVLRLVLGSNGGATLASHISFLAGALDIPQNHVSIGIVAFQTSLFHPKVYHFTRTDGSQSAYVGSANFTGPGVSGLNIEAGVILDTRDGDDPSHLSMISERIENWFSQDGNGVSVVTSASDIDDLLSGGVLALKPIRRQPNPSDENEQSGRGGNTRLATLGPIYRLPKVADTSEQDGAGSISESFERATRPSVRRFTEASFHYPQGTHLGHILAILKYCSGERAGGPFDDRYIRMNGGLGEGRLAAFRRQIKYKLLAATELGLLEDIRYVDDAANYQLALTPLGDAIWLKFSSAISPSDLLFRTSEDGDLSTVLPKAPAYYNKLIRKICENDIETRELYVNAVLAMPAAGQMLGFLRAATSTEVQKTDVYGNFFHYQPVLDFCDAVGIEPGTEESAKHRCPFLINLLDSCGIVDQSPKLVSLR